MKQYRTRESEGDQCVAEFELFDSEDTFFVRVGFDYNFGCTIEMDTQNDSSGATIDEVSCRFGFANSESLAVCLMFELRERLQDYVATATQF